MGLDQYLWLDRLDGEPAEKVFVWRKHPNLHGFMEKHWLQLNPAHASMDFNCEDLDLTFEILDDMETCLHPTEATSEFPTTTGFFFGTSDNYYDDQDRKALEFARGALLQKHRIYYTSWW